LSIDHLYQEKYNKRASGLIKRSKFRIQDADVASIHYETREIDRQTLQELATCNYINHRQNIILQVFTGSGKTYLPCALGKEACKQAIRTRYVRRPDLLIERDEATLKPKSVTNLDYCGPIAPSGRILAPPNADRNSMRAEGAPL